jgi:hypothetical protein
VRTSIPNPTNRTTPSGGQFNNLVEFAEGATYRGRAHKTTRGIIPRQQARISGGSQFTHPLQVYLSGGYICIRKGYHIWFNSYTETATATSIEKQVSDAWEAYTTGSRTVYISRTYNVNGTATVTPVSTTDSYATVIAGITNTEARWILATISDGVVTQWRTAGDIDELRVA